jgi:carboxyl-terminal processing protease
MRLFRSGRHLTASALLSLGAISLPQTSAQTAIAPSPVRETPAAFPLRRTSTATPSLLQPVRPTRLTQLIEAGQRQEQGGAWQQAAEIYERAARLFPGDGDVRNRWRRCERLHSLGRRYHDRSYTEELLALTPERAQTLLREVLGRISSHYVAEVGLKRLLAIGHENLDLALTCPDFLQRVGLAGRTAAINGLRRDLALRVDRIAEPETVDAAIGEILESTRVCRRYGVTSDAPILLEFVAGISEGLDPYSTHLTPNRLRDLYSTIDGNFVGLGVEVKGNADGLLILRTLPESPAEEAGLRGGMTVAEIDGKALVGVHPEEAANLLQGPEGSTVRLGVKLPGGDRRDLSVVRREVIVHSVLDARLLDRGGLGYLRIDSFQKNTLPELDRAIGSLQSAGLKGLIIDLRGNPGGLLEVALQTANRFVPDGVIVSTRGRAPNQSQVHRAKPLAVWDTPMTVLIDGDSASASEIFAGAMKDHARATLVGTRSFGKGSVQSIYPLRSADAGLRLTTAHFYSPKGRVYQNEGVEPDLVVTRPTGPLGEEIPLVGPPDPTNDEQLSAALATFRKQLAGR